MWFYTPYLPPLDHAAIGRRRLLVFSLAKLFLSPGMAHFSSKNFRIEVSEITEGFYFTDYEILKQLPS